MEIPAEKESNMKNFLQIALLTVALAGVAAASDHPTVPEIGAGSAAGAVGLVAGVLLVMRARRK
jgi:hypothetical protein